MKQSKILPTRTKTIKIEVRLWETLKNMKNNNETFNDIIKELLKQRTQSTGNKNIKAIKFKRKTSFFTWKPINNKSKLGFEFEYNDIKNNQTDFTIDLKIKKVFVNKKIMNPSEFFGTDNTHKHYSNLFLLIYLQTIRLVLKKEFRISLSELKLLNIAEWKKLYYEYTLSQESFINDIEEPLRLSEDENIPKKTRENIKNSPSQKYK